MSPIGVHKMTEIYSHSSGDQRSESKMPAGSIVLLELPGKTLSLPLPASGYSGLMTPNSASVFM
jgi:hypothetical protein